MVKKEAITLVGTGPGGLTAAITLAKNGCNVNLYEQNNNAGLRITIKSRLTVDAFLIGIKIRSIHYKVIENLYFLK